MPVTAKLSKLFYDRLGEAVTNELVDWFNQVDAAYKTDLRELNEQNYARFEAKLDQRFAELGAQLRGEMAGMESRLDKKIEQSRAEMAGMESRLDKKIEQARAESAGTETRLDNKIEQLRAENAGMETRLSARMDVGFANLSASVDKRLQAQTRFLYFAWSAVLLAVWFRH